MANATLEDVPSVDFMTELLRCLKCSSKPDKRLILVGPPGSGKGTQSPIIKDEYCLCHLATGDMLRAAVVAKTPLGIKAKEAMEEGELVSDDLVVGIIDEAIKKTIMSERTYHTNFSPPKAPGVDDVTGQPLIQRKDDTAAVLKSRLEAFHKQTEPVEKLLSQ
ncbi:unnamed protein product [Vicia faba]|uniref:adenylate kinase n=1 Tax=Vicia faba TaxID=3906 RepID=A0AAV1B7I7_VICFA|nr:unnamed protein product [Vicia faba]